MTIPIRYNTRGGDAIASYNYTDIAEGTGIIVFYGTADATSAAAKYVLTQQSSILGQTVEYMGNPANGAPALMADYDFDLPAFNMPKIISGKMFISIPTAGINNTADDAYPTEYFIIKLRKYDGAEHEIASVQTSSHSYNLFDASKVSYNYLTEMDVPQTSFKRGDVLRITALYYAGKDNAVNISVGFAFDPTNNYTGSVYTSTLGKTSQMKFYVPFKIDL